MADAGGDARLRAGDALLITDVQNDFLPGGALGVPSGDAIVPVLNRYIADFVRAGLPVMACRDWHPGDHCSFRERGGPWPRHCVQGSEGARLASKLALPPAAPIVSKGTAPDREAYSAFESDLDARLRERGVRRLFVGGLTTDYCVRHTVEDALARGYRVVLLTDAIRPVDVAPEDGRRAEEEMIRRGAVPLRHDALRP